jgi:hypothetical protein
MLNALKGAGKQSTEVKARDRHLNGSPNDGVRMACAWRVGGMWPSRVTFNDARLPCARTADVPARRIAVEYACSARCFAR